MAVDHSTGLPDTQPETRVLLFSILVLLFSHTCQQNINELTEGVWLRSSVLSGFCPVCCPVCVFVLSVSQHSQACLFPSTWFFQWLFLWGSSAWDPRINQLTALTCANWSSGTGEGALPVPSPPHTPYSQYHIPLTPRSDGSAMSDQLI